MPWIFMRDLVPYLAVSKGTIYAIIQEWKSERKPHEQLITFRKEGRLAHIISKLSPEAFVPYYKSGV